MEGDASTTAGLFALAMGLMKVLEIMATWLVKKMGPTKEKSEKVLVVQLDPEVSRMIRDTHDNVHRMHDVLSVKDHDGVPMVYSSRTTAENVNSIAAAMRDVASAQERIAGVIEKIEDKVDDLKK